MNPVTYWAIVAVSALGTSHLDAAEDHSMHQRSSSSSEHAGHTMPQQKGSDPAVPYESAEAHSQRSETAGDQPTESERRHVAPDPPQHSMRDMSEKEMIELMEMDDTSTVGLVVFDELEWRRTEGDGALGWDITGWYGNDYDKLLAKSDGSGIDDESESRNELLWDRIIARWWHLQAGARQDFGEGPARTWAAVGFEGLAPQWFDVEGTAYFGDAGRTALRFEAKYDLLLTQRLVLRPKLEFNVYGKNDRRNLIGKGLSDTEVGLRLRYELRREFAPYLGVSWTRLYRATADFARAAGGDESEFEAIAGVRWWF